MRANTSEFNRYQQPLRIQAETQTVFSESKNKPILSAIGELMDKLNEYQLQLEQQNEALRQENVALEASREHYRDLFDHAPVGYLTLNAEGVIVEINLTGANWLGVERTNLINRHLELFIEEDYKDLWCQHLLLAKQQVGKYGCTLPHRHEKGIIFYLHLDCVYIDADNGGTSQLRITLTDITERKQSDEVQGIIDVAFETQSSLLVTDAQKVILLVNQAFSRITGYSAEDVIGKTPAFLQSGLHDEAFYKALWASLVHNGYWQGEVWNKRKNGELFPVLQSITAITDINGCITHYVSSLMDITVQKQAEKELRDAYERLDNQVVTSQEDLEKIKDETEKVNTALNVLLKHRETDKTVIQTAFSDEVEATVLPLLKKLKTVSAGRLQTIRLAKILETNLQQLVTSYGHATNLAAAYKKLTPTEKQVASMIRQGIPSKVIAAALNVSHGTISVHRKHIRKKLGLENNDVSFNNLHSYLNSLSE